MSAVPAQLAEEPGPRHLPVALHRPLGDAEDLGDLAVGQAAEEAQLDDLRHARVRLGQLAEQVVDGDQVLVVGVGPRVGAVDVDPDQAAAALLGPPRPGVVDEQPAHGDGRHHEELRLGPGGERGAAGHVHEELADQPRRLQRVIAALAAHVRLGDPPQFGIQERDDAVARLDVGLGLGQQGGQVGGQVARRRAIDV